MGPCVLKIQVRTPIINTHVRAELLMHRPSAVPSDANLRFSAIDSASAVEAEMLHRGLLNLLISVPFAYYNQDLQVRPHV